MNSVFEPKPRWPGAPKICIKENLPAFESEAKLKKYANELPAMSIVDTWKCEHCGWLHYHESMRPPSGSSAGKSRAGSKTLNIRKK